MVDLDVRRVWQINGEKVRVEGAAWAQTLSSILERLRSELGCGDIEVRAQLYKMLVYDEGAFFSPHRDTEKVDGMFASLVVALPSHHRGGELYVRHAGEERIVDLTGDDAAQIKYAAFYADCEHEVRPITEGYRVCFVYNLFQPTGSQQQPLRAPEYSDEIESAAQILNDHLRAEDAAPKLVYLLEHQYSPAGLSFGGLKNRDAALVSVLLQAAQQAQFALHLGLVHIEECGSAEPIYDFRPRRYARYQRSYVDDDVDVDNIDVIEVIDSRRTLDQWVGVEGPVQFGEIPLEDGELLPAGSLEGEKPDEQRLTEATGNEGASFERSYHRSAVVMWPRERQGDVLLQAGVASAIPHLQQELRRCGDHVPDQVLDFAQRMIDMWAENAGAPYVFRWPKQPSPDRAVMLDTLREMRHLPLMQSFIHRVAALQFDGAETPQLAQALISLDEAESQKLIRRVMYYSFGTHPAAGVALLQKLQKMGGHNIVAAAVDDVVAHLSQPRPKSVDDDVDEALWKDDPVLYRRWENEGRQELDADILAALWRVLRRVDDETNNARRTSSTRSALETLSTTIAKYHSVALDEVVAPALVHIVQEDPSVTHQRAFKHLWDATTRFLEERSGQLPMEPTDWAQEIQLECTCEDCEALLRFARSPNARVARFPMRKDRRAHIHRQIDWHELDITHVTQRKGSPYILVCTKNRRSYENRLTQYDADQEQLRALRRCVGN